MLTCAFFGHREILLPDIPQKLDAALSLLLARDTAFCFLVGGMGEFDAMAAQAVRRAKRREPQKQIALHLVLPYMENRLNRFPDEYRARFDEIYIPAGLAGVYFKRAIAGWSIRRRLSLPASIAISAGRTRPLNTRASAEKKSLRLLDISARCAYHKPRLRFLYRAGAFRECVPFYGRIPCR